MHGIARSECGDAHWPLRAAPTVSMVQGVCSSAAPGLRRRKYRNGRHPFSGTPAVGATLKFQDAGPYHAMDTRSFLVSSCLQEPCPLGFRGNVGSSLE